MSNVIFGNKLMKIGIATVLSITLAACEEGKTPSLFKGNGQGGGIFNKKSEGGGLFGKKNPDETASQNDAIKLVERDVESPEVFQTTEKALWDGRPSLGGVWVAHPDSNQPERVIIRNETNSKFVIGALFKRERDNPGPRLQVSSDAAAALGVLAGAPTTLNVTVLRRETVTVDDGGGSPVEPETVVTEVLAPTPTEEIEAAVLKSVAEAETKQKTPKTIARTNVPKEEPPKSKDLTAKKPVLRSTGDTKTASATTPKDLTAVKSTTKLSQPFIQLGFFSVETNARNTLKALETRKIPGKLVKATAKGKTFWRVLAGPSHTKGERDAYMAEIKKMGFSDAYLTKN